MRLRWTAGREQAAELAREGELSLPKAGVERLDSEPVAGQDETAPARVPERHIPHPVHALEERLSPLRPAVREDLGVGGGRELVAAGLELGPELDVVVDLAAEGHPHLAVGGRERLMAARREIDDGEPDVAQDERSIGGVRDAPRRGIGSRIAEPGGRRPRTRERHRRRSATGVDRDIALVVGAAVPHGAGHPAHARHLDRAAIRPKDARDATHRR